MKKNIDAANDCCKDVVSCNRLHEYIEKNQGVNLTPGTKELLKNKDFLAYNLGLEIYKNVKKRVTGGGINGSDWHVPFLQLINDKSISVFADICRGESINTGQVDGEIICGVVGCNGTVYGAIPSFSDRMEDLLLRDVLSKEQCQKIISRDSIEGGVCCRYFLDSLNNNCLVSSLNEKNTLAPNKRLQVFKMSLEFARLIKEIKRLSWKK